MSIAKCDECIALRTEELCMSCLQGQMKMNRIKELQKATKWQKFLAWIFEGDVEDRGDWIL